MTITLVTGNAGKLQEWQRLMPAGYTLESADIDLPEIQSLDLEVIVADKARRAYEAVGSPVIVEDIAAGLDRLGGLPGPFVKFFVATLGPGALRTLAQAEGERAAVSCVAAYFDGQELITVTGRTEGTIVAVRGDHGFGFDKTFVPAGQDLTYGQMTPGQKDAVSHRGKAVTLLVKELAKL